MARGNYEKSPRQRLEWHGGQNEFEFETNNADMGGRIGQVILSSQPRITLSAGTVNEMAFPAGIVRGESCSIARFIAHVSLYDLDRRQQNVSFEVGCCLVPVKVEDDVVADPLSTGGLLSPPDPLDDLRASFLWHHQELWNPQSAGANYTVFKVDTAVDSTNSRIFESNDVLQFGVQMRTRQNAGTAPVSTTVRSTIMWRALMRLD